MSADFKSEFNAVHEKQTQAEQKSQASLDNYVKTALQEYPRLCEKLANEIQELFNGVKGAEVEVSISEGSIDHFDGKRAVSLAKVKVKSIKVKFGLKFISFSPAGVNYMGVQGKIDVKTSHTNPFGKEAVFLVSNKENRDEWQLAIWGQHSRMVALDGEMLQKLLKQALL